MKRPPRIIDPIQRVRDVAANRLGVRTQRDYDQRDDYVARRSRSATLSIRDEGSLMTGEASAIDFVGAGVAVAQDGYTTTVTVGGASSTEIDVTLGPFYIDDLAGTSAQQAQLGMFNAPTALSKTTTDLKIQKAGTIIGALIVSDDARTAGTATVKVRINGANTTFDGGSVVLDGTNTLSDSSFVAVSSGVAVVAGDTVGANVTTSGWTPTTANVSVWLVLRITAF